MWSRKELALGVLALATVPAILTCVNPGWLFAPPGIDTWVYMGFFRHFPEYQAGGFPETYYGSRLSWVLPGYCVHQLLPPVTANCVLHLGVHLLAVLSLFEALRHTASARAAFLAALLLAGHGPFLAAVGWDYVDGVGTAYYLLTWALLVRAARSETPRPWLFGAGAAAAAALYSNLFWLPLLGLTLPGYAALYRRWHGRVFVSNMDTLLVWMVCGAGMLTVGLGIANQQAGGLLLFFRPSIDYALSTVGKENPWSAPLSVWLPTAFWIVWPACAVVGSTVYLVRRQLRVADPEVLASRWWAVNLLLAAFVFVAATGRGQPLLQLSYYTSYLLGPLMLAGGTLLAAPLSRLSRPAFVAAAVFVMGCAALANAKFTTVPPLACALAFTLTGFVGLGFQPRVPWAVLTCIALLATGSAILPTEVAIHENLGGKPSLPHPRTRVALYTGVTTAAQFVEDHARTQGTEGGRKRIWFWYDAAEPLGTQHLSLASLWLWGYSMINDKFPNWAPWNKLALSPGDLVVVPSQRSDVIARTIENGGDKEFVLRLLGSRNVGKAENQFIVAVFVLVPRR